MARNSEVIDLADSSSDEVVAEGSLPSEASAGSKRKRELTPEEAAKEKIMLHAQGIANKNMPGPPRPQVEPIDLQSPGDDTDPVVADANVAKARIVQQARGVSTANALLKSLNEARMARQRPSSSAPSGSTIPLTAPGPSFASSGARQQAASTSGRLSSFSLLTWNVWFAEEVEVEARMRAIGQVILEKQPTFVCLQEVTPLIYDIFRQSRWFKQYMASVVPEGQPYFTTLLYRTTDITAASAFDIIHFGNSMMSRGLQHITVTLAAGNKSIKVSTTHLESPLGSDQLMSEPRSEQLKQALKFLNKERNAIIAGDLNWSEEAKKDGPIPLLPSWVDAWKELKGSQPGYTYDGKTNGMLANRFRTRLDRVLCKLVDWQLADIEMLGTEEIVGFTYSKKQWNGRMKELPVFPSDHYGLLLTMRPVNLRSVDTN